MAARLVGAIGVRLMLRVFFFVIALGVLVGLGALVYLGSFPPSPQQHMVDKTLPNDSFRH